MRNELRSYELHSFEKHSYFADLWLVVKRLSPPCVNLILSRHYLLHGIQGWRVVLTVNRAEECLAFERHLFDMLRMWLPLMPLVSNRIVAVKNCNAIDLFVCPFCAGMCDCLCEDKHGASGTGIIFPQR